VADEDLPVVEHDEEEAELPTSRTYTGLAPAATTPKRKNRREGGRRTSATTNNIFDIRLQIAFDRHGGVRNLALVPCRRRDLPGKVSVSGTGGKLDLIEFGDDYYESISITDAGKTLREGVAWKGHGDARGMQWMLSGRELYVLASGDASGIYPFGSTPCLLLHANHVVLAIDTLREAIEVALVEAGCAGFTVLADATPGVPAGWCVFRDVMPTKVVARREGTHFLNPLCPLPDVEPDYVGGIRLRGRVWLAGFPPRIRFTGVLGDDFQVLIDGHPAHPASDGGYEAPGWDSDGEHLLAFAGKTNTYAMLTMDENWERWHAHDFGTGAAICGASIHHVAGAKWRQVRVPVSNPVLVGARLGEVFYCAMRTDARCDFLTVLAPFDPVWALPRDPAHVDKRTARIVLLQPAEPVIARELPSGKRRVSYALRSWVAVINDAGRKNLELSSTDDDANGLWRRYRTAAKQLWRKMR
jgi:hypothetical protein